MPSPDLPQPPKYPEATAVRVEWTAVHLLLGAIALTAVGSAGWVIFSGKPGAASTALDLCGLALNIGGGTLAALRTPYYGHFHDGGALEVLREHRARPYFRAGMLTLAAGFALQLSAAWIRLFTAA